MPGSQCCPMVCTRMRPVSGSEWLFFAIFCDCLANGLDSRRGPWSPLICVKSLENEERLVGLLSCALDLAPGKIHCAFKTCGARYHCFCSSRQTLITSNRRLSSSSSHLISFFKVQFQSCCSTMKYTLATLALAAASLASPVPATSYDAPSSFKIVNVVSGGSGCPQGSIDVNWTDNKIFPICTSSHLAFQKPTTNPIPSIPFTRQNHCPPSSSQPPQHLP